MCQRPAHVPVGATRDASREGSMRNGLHGFACCLLLAASGSNDALAQQPATVPAAQDAEARSFVIDNKPWKGDFDAMLERRVIRVIVP